MHMYVINYYYSRVHSFAFLISDYASSCFFKISIALVMCGVESVHTNNVSSDCKSIVESRYIVNSLMLLFSHYIILICYKRIYIYLK